MNGPFVAPYLTSMTEETLQRDYPLRKVFNRPRWIIRAGASWRMMAHDLPPWWVTYQQSQRWIRASVFEAMVHDLRAVLCLATGCQEQPTAAIFDSRTLQSSPESGRRAGYDGSKRRKGSKTHIAVERLEHLLAFYVTPANEQDRAQVEELAHQVQKVTEQSVEVAFVNQGFTGEKPAEDAQGEGIRLEVIKLLESKKGFVLLPHHWVMDRSFAWATRLRRLARDYKHLPEALAGLRYLAFAILMLRNVVHLMTHVL